jgi:hypothetical protein
LKPSEPVHQPQQRCLNAFSSSSTQPATPVTVNPHIQHIPRNEGSGYFIFICFHSSFYDWLICLYSFSFNISLIFFCVLYLFSVFPLNNRNVLLSFTVMLSRSVLMRFLSHVGFNLFLYRSFRFITNTYTAFGGRKVKQYVTD